jgi:hypothetical protein
MNELNLNLTVENVTSDGCTFYFDEMSGPFLRANDHNIEKYCVFVVKDKMKSTISVTTAEALMLDSKSSIDSKCLIEVLPSEKLLGGSGFCKKITRKKLRDSDGDSLDTAESYVLFVLVVYTSNYKKKINNFDNYLTTPSSSFMFSD